MNNDSVSSEKIIKLIEENLFDLYRNAADQGDLKTCKCESFSWINASPACWPNYIFNTNVRVDNIGEVINEAENLISQKIAPSFWITVPDSESKVFQTKLIDHNFRLVMQWPGMAINLEKLSELPLIQGLDIRIIDDVNTLKEWIKITEICLFNGKFQKYEMMTSMMKNQNTKFILGLYNGIPVATLLSYLNNGIAGFFMGATLPEFRNKGIIRSLLLYGLSFAKNNGCRLGTLQANNMSKNIYLNIGFKEYCTFDIYWKMSN
jgi:hypothetical protein